MVTMEEMQEQMQLMMARVNVLTELVTESQSYMTEEAWWDFQQTHMGKSGNGKGTKAATGAVGSRLGRPGGSTAKGHGFLPKNWTGPSANFFCNDRTVRESAAAGLDSGNVQDAQRKGTGNGKDLNGTGKGALLGQIGQNMTDPAHTLRNQSCAQGAWTVLKTKARTKMDVQNRDILCPDGWNVPVVQKVEDLRYDSPGIALATTAEAKQYLLELKPEVKMALLVPKQLCPNAMQMSVLVTNQRGEEILRPRWLHQMGPEPVELLTKHPKKNIVKDTAGVVIKVAEKYCGKDPWDAVRSADAKQAVRGWLVKHAGVQVLDVSWPQRIAGVSGELQCVAQVSKIGKDKVIKSSGKTGFFTRDFIEKSEVTVRQEDPYKMVPLDTSVDLASALRMSANLGDDSWGLTYTKLGLGIKVLKDQYERVLKLLRPDDYANFLGLRYEVSGLPCNCGEAALTEMLSPWAFRTVYTERKGWTRTWIVQSVTPPEETMVQHEFGLARISLEKKKERKQRPVEVMRKPGGHTKGGKAWTAALHTGIPTRPNVPAQTGMAVDTPPPFAALAVSHATAPSSITTPPDFAAIIAAAVQAAMGPLIAKVDCISSEFMAIRAASDPDSLEPGWAPETYDSTGINSENSYLLEAKGKGKGSHPYDA